MSASEHQDPDWLREKYHGEGLTQAEIAEKVDVCPKTISWYMNRLGIETREPSELFEHDRPDGVDPDLWESLGAKKRYIVRKRARVNELRQDWSCGECGEDDPAVLQFHHTDDNEWSYSPSTMIRRLGHESIEAEIERGEVLCANCHMKRHGGNNTTVMTAAEMAEEVAD